jgi:hypothetical protein
MLFALVATSLTRARSDMSSPTLLAQVLVPTVLTASVASRVLICASGLAGLKKWVLAGVLVPVGAVTGFFLPFVGLGVLFLMFVLVGSVIAVPIGLAGHLLLRHLLSIWHHSASSPL